MKKVFIPAGEIVSYNSLHTGRVVVRGTLRVSGKLVAKEITGGGIVEAREIVCDDMRVSCATADFVTTRKIAADKLFVRFECRASGQIAVRDYLTAGYVSTGTLSVSLSDVGSCDADKVIMVRQRGSLLGLLWASWWRGLFLDLFYGGERKAGKDEKAAPEPIIEAPPASIEGTDDSTIDLMITVLTELRKQGYRVSRPAAAPAGEGKAA